MWWSGPRYGCQLRELEISTWWYASRGLQISNGYHQSTYMPSKRGTLKWATTNIFLLNLGSNDFQIRVDFVDTELMDPVRGECLSQFFIVQGDIWPTGLPPLCGINNDQHCTHINDEWLIFLAARLTYKMQLNVLILRIFSLPAPGTVVH